MAFDLERHSRARGPASEQNQLPESRHHSNQSWPMPPTYHSKTDGTRYHFPTSADRPSSASSLRIIDSPSTSDTRLPDQTVYSNVAFPPVKPFTSQSFSAGTAHYVEGPLPGHSTLDQDARPALSPHHVHEHPRRTSSLGIRKGMESRRASLPTAPTTIHHSRGSRFWRTVLHDDPITDRPRFLSSARGPAPRIHRNSDALSQLSISNLPSVRPGSPQLWRASNRINPARPSYTRTVSDTQSVHNVYSVPGSYPAIPPLVFQTSSRTSRTSLPDFSVPSSRDTFVRDAEHVRNHSPELLPSLSKADNDYEDETEGDDQFDSHAEVGESVAESESDVEYESDIDYDKNSLKSDEQDYDLQRRLENSRESFVPASSSPSAMERASTDSLQIVRIVELGPSPTNPSAIITEDRRYPCPHVGCPQVCKRRYDLERHLASKQHAPPRHTCDVCGLAFTRKDPLMRHQKASCRRVGQ